MSYNDAMHNKLEGAPPSRPLDSERILTRARSVLTPEQAARMDQHWKMLLDHFSTEDGHPRRPAPTSAAVSEPRA